jgi:hypothetical protein
MEGTTSEQIPITPFDTSQNIALAGTASEGEQLRFVAEVDSNAPAAGNPSYIDTEYLTGNLNLRERNYYGYGNLQNDGSVGKKGYVIFDWGGPGKNLMNVLPPFSVANISGWADKTDGGVKRQFSVNGVAGASDALTASPVGTISLAASDSNFHYLTVFSPPSFNGPKVFKLGITSTNGNSVQYNVNEPYGHWDIFQFLFKGNITIYADATGGNDAIVQAIFLDDAPVTTSSPAQTVPTATTLTSSQNPASAGSVVTFSAMVNGSGGMPTGTVAFLDGINNLGMGTLNSSGMAALSIASLSADGSPHAITAVYGGNSAFGGSTSAILSQSITNGSSNPTYTDITNGLVASYPLAGDVSDHSGNGHNATAAGTIAYTDGVLSIPDTALLPDGTTTSLTTSNLSAAISTSISISGWIKPEDFETAHSGFGFRAPGDTPGAFYVYILNTGDYEVRFRNSSGTAFTSDSIPVATNVWTFVGLTYDGSTLTFYTNGVFAASVAANGTLGSSTLSFFIGDSDYLNYLPDFPMCNIRLYNRALSATEIGTLYANGAAGAPVTITPVLHPPSQFRILGP